MSERVVLAYSGGLDTSCILKYLQQKGYEVVAFIANLGQEDDFSVLERRARDQGAVAVHVEDLRRTFVTEFVLPSIAGNALYENRYLLGTSLARPLIARGQVEVALAEGAGWISHGATGKGNDQVRFELAYAALAPQLRVFAPWKDPEFLGRFRGRSDLLRYAEEHGLKLDVSVEKPWSTDENLMHKSYEAGLLEDPMWAPPDEMFDRTRSPMEAPDQPVDLVLHFESARPTALVLPAEDRTITDPLELFVELDRLGGEHGIGRVDMVENRFVGIKSRGVYETPGGTILFCALRDLEGVAMDREVLRVRDLLAKCFGQLIYSGFWFSPEMDVIRAAFAQAERGVDGRVALRLYKGNVIPRGRESSRSLYDRELSSMDVEGGYDQTDARGFIRLNALRLRAYRRLQGAARGESGVAAQAPAASGARTEAAAVAGAGKGRD
ncbi:MAG TPA: argininosuccinate synthase [Thermoanaerobaculia bacterium]|nr:argininosuccinate synthase [Thermoanaerobaculia bacterium]